MLAWEFCPSGDQRHLGQAQESAVGGTIPAEDETESEPVQPSCISKKSPSGRSLAVGHPSGGEVPGNIQTSITGQVGGVAARCSHGRKPRAGTWCLGKYQTGLWSHRKWIRRSIFVHSKREAPHSQNWDAGLHRTRAACAAPLGFP